MSEDLRFISQNHPVSIILALISPYIHFEYTCEEKSYKEQMCEDQMSRNYSSTIVAVIVALF